MEDSGGYECHLAFHRHLKNIKSGLNGVQDVADDVLCVGKSDTLEEAMIDHDRNLIALLERCREKNIKLNDKKMKLKL